MTDAIKKSIFQDVLQDRAKETGKTVREVLDAERERALSASSMTDDCLLPNEALELIRMGVRYANQQIEMVELPPLYRVAGKHVELCNHCKGLIGIMTPRHIV